MTQTINIQSNDPVKIKPTQKDTVFEWFEDERTFSDIDELLKLLEIQPGHFFWGILKSLPIEHAIHVIDNMTISDEIRVKCKEIISRHD
ncbi:MAG: hypothetical protein HRU38_12765 [Saccharospirillaceae bacterium]|nr:hypothetical protein [Pseudomonadales bacterium]NRB79516.1 hypothetical protein [Saccharospirillaceae bacterium]